MTSRTQNLSLPLFSRTLLLFWVLILLLSSLPNILWIESTSQSDRWLLPIKAAVLLGVLGLSWVREEARPFRPFSIILLVLMAAEWGITQVSTMAWWQDLFEGESPFVSGMLGIQAGRLLVSLVIVGALLLLKRNPRAIFLTPGNLNATAQPVSLLGMKEPQSWRRFGVTSLVIMSGVLLTFLFMAGRPSAAILLSVVPMLPFVLLFALMNSWGEEVSYRVSLIATTEDIAGSSQAVWLSALFFGIGHFYGVPYGIVGVLLSTFFGYLLGKSLVETRGLAWAWLLHFVADIWVFTFMAIGSITPGG